MAPAPGRVTLDCPTCGERVLDIDMHEWAAMMPAEKFGDAVKRLVKAHDDSCTPRRLRPEPADRRLRFWWWGSQIIVPVAWSGVGIVTLTGAGDAGYVSTGLAWLFGGVLLALKPVEVINQFRGGYLRGRAETLVGLPPIAPINLHPADRWRRPPGLDDDEDDGAEDGGRS